MLNRCLNTESSLEIGTLSTWRHCETSRGRSFVVRSSEDTHPALNTGQEMNYNYHQYRAGRAGNLTTAAWKLAQLFTPVLDTIDTSKLLYTSTNARYYSCSVGYLRHFVGFVLSHPDRRERLSWHILNLDPRPRPGVACGPRSDFVNFPL